MFSVCIINRISSLVPLMSAFLQWFKPVHVTNISVSMFSILVDVKTLVRLNLHINFSGEYLSTKLVYGSKLLMPINTGFKGSQLNQVLYSQNHEGVHNWQLVILFFFFRFCSGFTKNYIEISFEKIFAGDPSNFLNASENSFSPV